MWDANRGSFVGKLAANCWSYFGLQLELREEVGGERDVAMSSRLGTSRYGRLLIHVQNVHAKSLPTNVLG